jgi:transposase
VALEAVKHIDSLFDIERGINGLAATNVCASGETTARPLGPLWKIGCARSDPACRAASVTQPSDYMLKRWNDFSASPQ